VPTSDEMTYGERLKRLRVGLQPPLDQKDLAALLGVHVTTISRWENNQVLPAADQIRPLARVLRVPVEWVVPPETE
jgi:transcriptional regulator with XRE-family HTH domain